MLKGRIYQELVWTPEMVSRFWDWQSQYPETYFTHLFGAEIARSLKPYLHGKGRVLDYGCGVGYLLPHLCRYAREVYGTDLSEESVARTNERLAGTPCFGGALPLSDLRQKRTPFDLILAVEVIEHLYDADLDAMLSDLRDLLAPNGVVVLTTPNDEDREKNMILCPVTGELFHRWQHVRSWNTETLPARIRKAGFSIVEVRETNLAEPAVRTPLELMKRLIKRMLLGNPGTPHLVCIAGLPTASQINSRR